MLGARGRGLWDWGRAHRAEFAARRAFGTRLPREAGSAIRPLSPSSGSWATDNRYTLCPLGFSKSGVYYQKRKPLVRWRLEGAVTIGDVRGVLCWGSHGLGVHFPWSGGVGVAPRRLGSAWAAGRRGPQAAVCTCVSVCVYVSTRLLECMCIVRIRECVLTYICV